MDRLFKIHASQCAKIMSNAKGSGLSVTCQTFLKEWYANDNEQIHSKYLDKGNEKEAEAIDFAASVLGYGMAEKNQVTASDEYMVGTCDVDFPDCVTDVKCPWNRKTFLDNIYGADPDYIWQLRVYMRLWNKEKAILFYALMNTPENDFYPEVVYEDAPDNQRWIAYGVDRDIALEQKIIDKVIECRAWLEGYDALVKQSLGVIK